MAIQIEVKSDAVNVTQQEEQTNVEVESGVIVLKEVEEAPVYIRASDGYIQYSNDAETWVNVIALSELKGEDGEDGVDGYTPQKGVDYFDGKDGSKGGDGVGIQSVEQTTTSSADGGNNVITVTLTNGQTMTFTVKNGSKGSKGDNGSDATVTATNIKTALGYTPANQTKVDQLSEDIADYKTEVDNLKESIPSVPDVPVTSVNGKTGAVVLSASDVGATTEAWVNTQINTLKAQGVQQVPLFANSIEDCTDKTKFYVLPDGFIYACVKETIATEGETVPNFTNLLNDSRTIIKTGKRFSTSNVAWKDVTGGTSYLVPIPTGSVTLRVRNYTHAGYEAVYGFTDENTYKATLSSTGMGTSTGEKAVTFTNSASNYAVFCSKPESVEIITVNEEITYTTTQGGTETVETWKSTGHAFVPADYEDTIIAIQNELAELRAEQTTLKKALADVQAYSVGEVFAPSPQLPANSSAESDINADDCTSQDIYDYIDAVMTDYPNYIEKETLGKDQSGTYDVCRYVLSRHFYKAWQKKNYPKMYAWVNGSTIIYSTSVSPRIGDTLYSTTYVGTSKGTVTVVDNANDSRTVGGVVYTRDKSKDIEPTLVYTTILDEDGYSNNGDEDTGDKVYNESLGEATTISSVSGNTFVGADGITYTRYPMGDRDSEFKKFVVMTIGSNEHGPALDPRDGAIVCARLIKDLAECRNSNNLFLNHIKNNVMLIFIPVINPYGFTLGTSSPHGDGYYNYNGVNINRNYDCAGFGVDTAGEFYAGEYGGSENETQYFMNTISEPNSDVAISVHILGVNNDNMCHYQGNGFDESKIKKIAEVMKSNYNLNFTSYGTAPLTTTAKSPTYITKAGAKGGIIEFQNRIGGSGTRHTERAMEGCYTLLLEAMHMWLTDLS